VEFRRSIRTRLVATIRPLVHWLLMAMIPAPPTRQPVIQRSIATPRVSPTPPTVRKRWSVTRPVL
jgi:hypothetical protein